MNEQTKLSFSGRCLNWRPLPLLQAIFVLAGLLLAASTAQAQDKPENGQNFDNWKTLGSGYVARRKVPPKMEMPVGQRRLSTTQESLAPGKGNTLKRLSNEKIVTMGVTMGAGEKNKIEGKKNKSALWLRTGAAGFYGVSITELAAEMGEKEKSLRKEAEKGGISLTNAGAPVSWYFDSDSDIFLFAGESYDNFYTDENAYYLTLDKKEARPVEVADGAPTHSLGVSSPFSDTLKFEEEPDMNFRTWMVNDEPDADYWFWDFVWGGFGGNWDVLEVPLYIPDPASNGMAQIRITMRGGTDLYEGDEHTIHAELNGKPIGSSITWDAFDQVVLEADFDQSIPGILDPSGNNTLSLVSTYQQGTAPGEWLDAIELDYSRLPVAVNGVLRLHAVEAGTQQVTGFAGENIMVMESPAGSAVMREDIRIEADGPDGWMVTFDTNAGADYLVVEAGALEAPSLALATPSKLDNKKNRADYLIIAPRDFEGTASALADYRGKGKGKRFKHVEIVWLDEIYSEFSYGRVDPFAIREFMKSVDKWKESPSYVTLVGKGSLDQKNRMGYADSFMPVVMTANPWDLAASDERLLAGEDGATFAIGRLPITNDAEGMAYVDKLIDFESMIPGSERYEAVLVADNPDHAGDFHANSELLADRLLGSLGFNAVTRLYHPSAPSVRSSLILSSTWETGYISYVGHGSTTQIGDGNTENFIRAGDAGNLLNTTYPIFTALTCAAGSDTFPGTRSLAGALVLNPVGGAIVALAPTGLGNDVDAQLLGNAFVDSLFGDNDTIGEALEDAKFETSNTIPAYMPGMYSVVGEPGTYAR